MLKVIYSFTFLLTNPIKYFVFGFIIITILECWCILRQVVFICTISIYNTYFNTELSRLNNNTCDGTVLCGMSQVEWARTVTVTFLFVQLISYCISSLSYFVNYFYTQAHGDGLYKKYVTKHEHPKIVYNV